VQAQNGKPSTRIHQEVDFDVPRPLFTRPCSTRDNSARSAEIDAQTGGSLKLFGGLIEARNVELVPNQRIVQAWREASLPPGHYSLVRFALVTRNAGTHLAFDQTGIAEDDWGAPQSRMANPLLDAGSQVPGALNCRSI
jgi:activator of HSP90 ATPase